MAGGQLNRSCRLRDTLQSLGPVAARAAWLLPLCALAGFLRPSHAGPTIRLIVEGERDHSAATRVVGNPLGRRTLAQTLAIAQRLGVRSAATGPLDKAAGQDLLVDFGRQSALADGRRSSNGERVIVMGRDRRSHFVATLSVRFELIPDVSPIPNPLSINPVSRLALSRQNHRYRIPARERRSARTALPVFAIPQAAPEHRINLYLRRKLGNPDGPKIRFALGVDTDWSVASAGRDLTPGMTVPLKTHARIGDRVVHQVAILVAPRDAGPQIQNSLQYSAVVSR